MRIYNKTYNWMFLLFGIPILQGCATPLPDTLSKPAPNDPGIGNVRANLTPNLNKVVRWGGTIASIQNQAKDTLIEVVERSLNSSGRPKMSGPSGGRFIAKVTQFLDPEEFDKGVQITIHGVVTGSETRKIGDHHYLYPLINVQTLHRWEPEPIYHPHYYPYSPFWYDPWYPHRYYPRRHHFPHHTNHRPH